MGRLEGITKGLGKIVIVFVFLISLLNGILSLLTPKSVDIKTNPSSELNFISDILLDSSFEFELLIPFDEGQYSFCVSKTNIHSLFEVTHKLPLGSK